MPDYHLAAGERHERTCDGARSCILLTNLRDEDDDTLLPALKLLRTRHLVVLASLREAILGRALSARVDSFDRAVTHAAAAEYLSLRERVFRRIGAAGVMLPGRGARAAADLSGQPLPRAQTRRKVVTTGL